MLFSLPSLHGLPSLPRFPALTWLPLPRNPSLPRLLGSEEKENPRFPLPRLPSL